MNPYREHDEDQDDDQDDWDQEDGLGDADDDEPTVPCPYCREPILEDSPRCPFCERYISEEDFAAPNKPVWVIATTLVCLGIAIWWVFAVFADEQVAQPLRLVRP